MKVFVNEKAVEVSEPADVVRVLETVDVEPDRRGIAVAINERVVRRTEWSEYSVSEGDRIEIIQATQGG